MAQTPRSKRLSQQEKAPAAASSSEDEGESGEESSEEEPPQTKKIAAPSAAKKPKPSSESDRPPQVVSKPIASSKPVDDVSKLKTKKKKARSESTADVPSTPTTKSTGKRPAENTGGEVKESKRAVKKMKGAEADGDAAEKMKGAKADGDAAEKMKGAEADGDAAEKMKGAEADGDAAEKKEKKKEAGEESSKRPLFQRLWSDGDEIVILEGLAELVKQGVADPPSDADAFLKSIQKSLSIVVVKSQLADKIRRLKNKFINNAKRGKNGADPFFSNRHELNVFNLSKPVWGGIGGGGPDLRKSKRNGKTLKVEVKEDLEEEFLLRMYRKLEFGGVGKLDDGILKRGQALLDPAIRADLERKYRKLEFDALQLSLRRISLLKEHLKLSKEACDPDQVGGGK